MRTQITARQRERETKREGKEGKLHVVALSVGFFSDKAKYAHLLAQSTDQYLLRNNMLPGPYKYPQDTPVGHRPAD